MRSCLNEKVKGGAADVCEGECLVGTKYMTPASLRIKSQQNKQKQLQDGGETKETRSKIFD